MASYLRPRRGKKATAVAQLTGQNVLKRGEVFFEVPDDGVGTGKGKIKMGDGSTAYTSLPYFLEPFDADNATIGWTNSTAAETDPYTTNVTHVNAIIPTANLKTIFTNLKQLLLNFNSQLTSLNNDLSIRLPFTKRAGQMITTSISCVVSNFTIRPSVLAICGSQNNETASMAIISFTGSTTCLVTNLASAKMTATYKNNTLTIKSGNEYSYASIYFLNLHPGVITIS